MSPARKALVAAALSLAAACATTPPPPEKPATPPPAPPAAPASAPKPSPPPPPRIPVKGEEALARQPALPPLKQFEAPVPRLVTLPNGLKLYVVERKGDGITAVRLVIRRGASYDPERRPGLASMTAAMMEAGSAGESGAGIPPPVGAPGAGPAAEGGAGGGLPGGRPPAPQSAPTWVG